MIGIGQMYQHSRKSNPFGIDGYKIEKKYQSTKHVLKDKNIQESTNEKKKQSKRGHYLQDYAKIHNQIPGPGQYNYQKNHWKKIKTENKCTIPTKKITFIQEIIDKQKKQKLPAPGQYNLIKTDKEIKIQKQKLSHKKTSFTQRYTYLDGVQYEASQIPGVGSYNTAFNRPKSALNLLKNKKLGILRSMSVLKKRQKCPSVGTYNPQQALKSRSFSKKNKGYHEWGRVERFKSQKNQSNLGPGVYTIKDQNKISKKGKSSIYYH